MIRHFNRLVALFFEMAVLAAGQLHKLFGISRPVYRDLRSRVLDFAEIVRGKVHCGAAEVLFEACELCGARDGPLVSDPAPCPSNISVIRFAYPDCEAK
jgi:hypothetical protein